MVLRSLFLVPLLLLSCAEVERDNPQDPDNVDGMVYSTTVRNGHLWMTQSLNRNVGDNKCYNDNPSNCGSRLYRWSTAKDLCPGGWHLPTQSEYNKVGCSGGTYEIGYGFASSHSWCWGAGARIYGTIYQFGEYRWEDSSAGENFVYAYVRCVKDSKVKNKEDL